MNTSAEETRNRTILLVEDDFDLRRTVCDLLAEEGYAVVAAPNGVEALGYLKSARTLPDLIVLDLMMPVMDGWEFRTRQNQDHRLSRVPVVVYSAYASHLPVKAVAVLAKSTPLEGLMSVVKRHAG